MIDYQSYLPILDLESIISQANNNQDFTNAKTLIMMYILSLKKENRNLHRRLNDKNY